MRLIPLGTSLATAVLLSGCAMLQSLPFFGSDDAHEQQHETTAEAPAAEGEAPGATAVALPPQNTNPTLAQPNMGAGSAPAVADSAAPARSTAAPQTTPRTEDSLLPGRFYVNAGAYAKAANAQRAQRLLSEAGLPVLTRAITTRRGAQLTGVRIGPFNTPEEAKQAATRARQLKLDTSIFQHRP